MKLLQTSTFCGCFDLKTGGLIIGYATLIFDIINVTLLESHWAISALSFVATVPMLYGIHCNRALWMIPELFCNIIELILCAVGAIFIIPICRLIFWAQTENYFIEIAQKCFEIEKTSMTLFVWIMWISLSIITVILWYFTAVLFSLYKSMKNENEYDSSDKYNSAAPA